MAGYGYTIMKVDGNCEQLCGIRFHMRHII